MEVNFPQLEPAEQAWVNYPRGEVIALKSDARMPYLVAANHDGTNKKLVNLTTGLFADYSTITLFFKYRATLNLEMA
jgi:hypothetical protein